MHAAFRMEASSEIQRQCQDKLFSIDRLIVEIEHTKQEGSAKERLCKAEIESLSAELARAKEAVRCKESELDCIAQETNASHRILSNRIDGLQKELEQAHVSEKEALDTALTAKEAATAAHARLSELESLALKREEEVRHLEGLIWLRQQEVMEKVFKALDLDGDPEQLEASLSRISSTVKEQRAEIDRLSARHLQYEQQIVKLDSELLAVCSY